MDREKREREGRGRERSVGRRDEFSCVEVWQNRERKEMKRFRGSFTKVAIHLSKAE